MPEALPSSRRCLKLGSHCRSSRAWVQRSFCCARNRRLRTSIPRSVVLERAGCVGPRGSPRACAACLAPACLVPARLWPGTHRGCSLCTNKRKYCRAQQKIHDLAVVQYKYLVATSSRSWTYGLSVPKYCTVASERDSFVVCMQTCHCDEIAYLANHPLANPASGGKKYG